MTIDKLPEAKTITSHNPTIFRQKCVPIHGQKPVLKKPTKLRKTEKHVTSNRQNFGKSKTEVQANNIQNSIVIQLGECRKYQLMEIVFKYLLLVSLQKTSICEKVVFSKSLVK